MHQTQGIRMYLKYEMYDNWKRWQGCVEAGKNVSAKNGLRYYVNEHESLPHHVVYRLSFCTSICKASFSTEIPSEINLLFLRKSVVVESLPLSICFCSYLQRAGDCLLFIFHFASHFSTSSSFCFCNSVSFFFWNILSFFVEFNQRQKLLDFSCAFQWWRDFWKHQAERPGPEINWAMGS